jgi:hypothetical protein
MQDLAPALETAVAELLDALYRARPGVVTVAVSAWRDGLACPDDARRAVRQALQTLGRPSARRSTGSRGQRPRSDPRRRPMSARHATSGSASSATRRPRERCGRRAGRRLPNPSQWHVDRGSRDLTPPPRHAGPPPAFDGWRHVRSGGRTVPGRTCRLGGSRTTLNRRNERPPMAPAIQAPGVEEAPHVTIRELREAHGWTQRQLANRVDVREGAVYAWEHGRTRPTRVHLQSWPRPSAWSRASWWGRDKWASGHDRIPSHRLESPQTERARRGVTSRSVRRGCNCYRTIRARGIHARRQGANSSTAGSGERFTNG